MMRVCPHAAMRCVLDRGRPCILAALPAPVDRRSVGRVFGCLARGDPLTEAEWRKSLEEGDGR